MIRLTVLNSSDYEYLLKQKPVVVSYAYGSTQFGKCFIGFIQNKVCHLSFVDETKKEDKLVTLKKEWPRASFVHDSKAGKSMVERVFKTDVDMEILVRGTAFQEKVWRELLKIRRGDAVCYSDVAAEIGYPKAVRAVANAVARNPVSYLIPCHRVISKNGDIYKYSGGCMTKKRLLDYEGFCG